jgi:hypothetical protein
VRQLESGKCYIKDLEEAYIPCNGSFPDGVEDPDAEDELWGK